MARGWSSRSFRTCRSPLEVLFCRRCLGLVGFWAPLKATLLWRREHPSLVRDEHCYYCCENEQPAFPYVFVCSVFRSFVCSPVRLAFFFFWSVCSLVFCLLACLFDVLVFFRLRLVLVLRTAWYRCKLPAPCCRTLRVGRRSNTKP